MLPFTAENNSFVVQNCNNNYKGGFFQVFIFDSKLDILPKTYRGGTNYIKISIKITHYQLL